MDALLILGGLLLIVAGLVWLVVMAFGTSLFWGVGSLLFPVTLAYVARHWKTSRKAVGLSSLGFIPLVVGLSLLASHDPERIGAILSMEWLEPEEGSESGQLSFNLHGELDGRSFSPRSGTLVDGVLTLSEGDALFASRELKVTLGIDPQGPVRIDVLPQDIDPVPNIEISWMEPDQSLPEARRVERGYTLHLDLLPVPPNKLAGDFHLVLPAHLRTSISGSVEVFTDELRYEAGQVDRNHDSLDTLAHVAKDYLQRRFGTAAVEVLSVSPVAFPATELNISADARIKERADRFQLALRKGDQGWTVKDDNYPPLGTQAEPAEPDAGPNQPQLVAARAQVDRRTRFSLERLLTNPARYEQLQMRAYTERGGAAEGRFIGIDRDGNLAIRRMVKGPGQVTYNLAPADIVLLELLEP